MAYLLLEDGQVFNGQPVGGLHSACGEVVFHTGMTGFQEVLTDPSLRGCIVGLTYPLVGSPGVNERDNASARIQVAGVVMAQLCGHPSNWLSQGSLGDTLAAQGVPGLTGVDTRALARHLRGKGIVRGRLVMDDNPPKAEESQASHPVSQVTCGEAYPIPGAGHHIALLDLGVRQGVLDALKARGLSVTVFPAATGAEAVLASGCAGVVISDGPGDANDLPGVLAAVKGLMGVKPLLGLGLGHQLMALSQGAKVIPLPTGHFGNSHPVKDLSRGFTYVTAQAHSRVVEDQTLPKHLAVSHVNMNDRSVEGLVYEGLKARSVQYSPVDDTTARSTGIVYDDFLALVQ